MKGPAKIVAWFVVSTMTELTGCSAEAVGSDAGQVAFDQSTLLNDDVEENVAEESDALTGVVDTGFDVKRHGFSFANKDWRNVCYTIVGATRLRYSPSSPLCLNDLGLCGGMSLVAGERFRNGMTSIDLTKPGAEPMIADGQMRTLDPGIVKKWLNWIAAPDRGHWHDPSHSVGYRMRKDWQNEIRPRLDRGEPVVIGLVRSKRARLTDLRELGAIAELDKQHAVLGIGYAQLDKKVELRCYDPNYPRDVLLMTFLPGKASVAERLASGAVIDQSRKAPRGLMFVRGVPTPTRPDDGTRPPERRHCPANRPKCCGSVTAEGCDGPCVGRNADCP
ncbi:hypothetical protein WME76_41240 [Sorangium sp. So ce119]|uniref:hypothetical protein n=1 Tax=Sorangium sp. So ce119 TaxID=3133279 RepID=UPI003F5EEEBE